MSVRDYRGPGKNAFKYIYSQNFKVLSVNKTPLPPPAISENGECV